MLPEKVLLSAISRFALPSTLASFLCGRQQWTMACKALLPRITRTSATSHSSTRNCSPVSRSGPRLLEPPALSPRRTAGAENSGFFCTAGTNCSPKSRLLWIAVGHCAVGIILAEIHWHFGSNFPIAHDALKVGLNNVTTSGMAASSNSNNTAFGFVSMERRLSFVRRSMLGKRNFILHQCNFHPEK